MFCQNCGAKNNDDSVFCEACGTRLEKHEGASIPQGQPMPQGQSIPQGQPAPQMQPFSNGNMPYPSAPAMQQPVPGKPVSKLTIALVIEVIALIAAGLCLSKISKDAFSAEKVAERYFVNAVNGDWDSAYDLIDVDETEFINGKMLKSAKEQEYIGDVSNYRVNKAKTDRDEETKQLGKDVEISYRTKGDGTDSSYTVALIKNEKKRFLLFEDWRVSTDYMLAKDFAITVVKGAKVTFDGVELTDKYITASEEDYEEYDYYTIPMIFVGVHHMSVTKDGYQPVEQTVWAYSDYDSASVYDMQLTAETIGALIDQAGNDMQAILSGITGGKAFADLGVSFTSDPDRLNTIMDDYNYITQESDFTKIDQLTITNVQGTASGSQVVVSFDYQIMYPYENWWTGDITHENYEGSDDWNFYYEQENGGWVLTNLGCTYLYY